MAIFQQGVVNSSKSTLNLSTSNQDKLNKVLKEFNSNNVIVRVTDIVLSESHPRFDEVGKFSGIGAIFFESYTANQPIEPVSSFALPGSSITKYPLVNEIVSLTKSPGKGFSINSSDSQYYYSSPIQIWNTPNQNSNPRITSKSKTKNNSYLSNNNGEIIEENEELFQANLNSPLDNSQEKFVEQANIRSLIPQAGDTIIEGRNGNSIRFSNNNGNPITLIRNGQDKTLPSKGFEGVKENIRNDGSSIYLSSTQQLEDFKVAGNENYSAFPTDSQPIVPSQYASHQIAINSNRIVIDAQEDSILLSAKNVLSVSVEGSVGITTPAFYVDSSKIRLGGNDAKEPILKGNVTVSLLKSLVESVKKLAEILEVEKKWPKGELITSNNSVAANTKSILTDLLNQLNLNETDPETSSNCLKSNTSKVK